MGRRKKEPLHVHREHIAKAAQILFSNKGIVATSMDDIAKGAGYSKATLYVYFENKEEIIGVLVLESMKKLSVYLATALQMQGTTKEKYENLCQGLVKYHDEYPDYFEMALDYINIEFEASSDEEKTFHEGEDINKMMKLFLMEGIQKGDVRKDIEILPTIFIFWGAISGLIQLSTKKESYILKTMNLTKQEFLQESFASLYRSISCGGNDGK